MNVTKQILGVATASALVNRYTEEARAAYQASEFRGQPRGMRGWISDGHYPSFYEYLQDWRRKHGVSRVMEGQDPVVRAADGIRMVAEASLISGLKQIAQNKVAEEAEIAALDAELDELEELELMDIEGGWG